MSNNWLKIPYDVLEIDHVEEQEVIRYRSDVQRYRRVCEYTRTKQELVIDKRWELVSVWDWYALGVGKLVG